MKDLFKMICTKPKLYEQSQNNIWEDEYISKNMLCAHLDEKQDPATRNMEFVKKSVEWIAAVLPVTKYPLLLDLGCGPGIYTELFYKKGYHVSGIDLSRRSIAYARNSACKNKFNIQYIQGDYTKIDFPASYNLITLIYCDFGVLPGPERKKLLHKVYHSLLPNGIFCFDVFTPLKYKGIKEMKQWEVEEKGFWKEELCLLLHSFYRYDEENTFLNQYVTITKKDLAFYYVWEHTFTLEELVQDLKEAGFQEMRIFGNVAGKKYETTDDTICILAQK